MDGDPPDRTAHPRGPSLGYGEARLFLATCAMNEIHKLTSTIHALVGMNFGLDLEPNDWSEELQPAVHALSALGATLKERVVSADHVAALFQATPVPLVQLSSNLVITATNPAALSLFGIGVEGLSLQVVLQDTAVVADTTIPSLAELLTGTRHALLDPLGNEVITDLRLAPLLDRYGELQGYVLSGQDVTVDATARDRAEKAQTQAERDAAHRTRFLAMVSHELRTPLNGIIGMAEFLTHPSAELRKQAVDVTRLCSEQLSGLISEFLDFAQLTSGTAKLERKVCDLSDMLEQCAKVVSSRLRPGITWQLDRSKMEWSHVLSDAVRLRQLLDNLIENSLKYTSSGHIHLTVETTKVDRHVRCRFIVEDSGCGIAPADLPYVFEPYRRLSTQSKGHGLGLAIASQLVSLLGGTIDIESTVDVGTRLDIRVELPAAPFEGAPKVVDRPIARALRVLSVDDNPVNRLVARMHLEQMGCMVTEAVDGVDGIEKFKEASEAFDLILMDCEMPRLDGPDASRELLRIGCNAPIVALTAHALRIQQDTCAQSGMVGFLTKPLRVSQLRSLLHRLFPDMRED